MTPTGIEMHQPASDNQCKIWPGSTALRVSELFEPMGTFYVHRSPRAGGDYMIDDLAAHWCEHNNDEKARRTKARLTTWLTNHPGVEYKAPRVTLERISQMESILDLPVPDRCERLLRKLASYGSRIIDITETSEHYRELLAWSESIENYELDHLIKILDRRDSVLFDGQYVSVSEAGYQHIQELNRIPTT